MRRLDWTRARLSLLAALGTTATVVAGCSADRAIGADGGDAGDHGGDADSGDGDGDAEDGGDADGDGGTDLPGDEEPCEGAEPVIVDGVDTGYLRCPDGTVNRETAVACTAINDEPACKGTEESLGCTSDADCTDGPNGRCVSRFFEGGIGDYCGCVYSCETDADCEAGRVCVCPTVATLDHATPYCAPAECSTNADCASGECGLSNYNDGCSNVAITVCRDDDDVCRLDEDCSDGFTTCDALWDGATYDWGCVSPGCAVGRPLLVDGGPRTAPVLARAGWDCELDVQVPADPVRRDVLARYWSEVAAMEHASVASFARFTLQLMAIGAPADLLADAQRAAADEVEHARIAYALASAFAGRTLGPGPMSMDDLTVALEANAIVDALVREACVGETLGVAEAMAAAETVDDPALASLCRRIADDELRHAGLAWRTLQWMTDVFPETRVAARRAYAEATEVALRDLPTGHPDLGVAELRSVRARALSELVAPAMRAALSNRGGVHHDA